MLHRPTAIACALAMLASGCVDTRAVDVDLYEPFGDTVLRSGFQCTCSDYVPPERQLLIAQAGQVAVVLEAVTWSSPGLPSCRGPDLSLHCEEVGCSVRADGPRRCVSVTLDDPDGGAGDEEILRHRMDTLASALPELSLPEVSDPAGLIRLVVVAGSCEDLGFEGGVYLPPADGVVPPFPPDRLVACANSCPTLFAEPDQPVRLGLTVSSCDEGALRQCAATPLVFGEVPERGGCRLPAD